jgi:hypothetical protein
MSLFFAMQEKNIATSFSSTFLSDHSIIFSSRGTDKLTDKQTESSEYRPDPPAAAGLVKMNK